MDDLTHEELDEIFYSLDLDQLEGLGYIIDSSSPDHLEDYLITIESEFSDLDREEKIAELKKIGLDEVQMSAETANRALLAGSVDGEPAMFYHEKGVTDRTGFTPGLILTGDESEIVAEASRIGGSVSEKRQKQGFKNYKRNVWSLKRAEGSGLQSYSGGSYGDIMTFGRINYEYDYEDCPVDLDSYDNVEDWIRREIRSTGAGEGDEVFEYTVTVEDEEKNETYDIDCSINVKWDHEYSDFNTAETGTHAAESKRERMKREKAEREMDDAATDVDYMREHYSESDAYIYAYNDGHRDGRDTSHKINYQPSASDRELTTFKKIFKQSEEFAADSPFNTLLLIREDIIIDDEEDFDRLLSIYMSLESDIAQLYQETDNPKHPLLAEMMRYRNRIANRLDELQEEVAIQDTIEMDAEHQRSSVPFTLERPLRTGYKLGLGWVAAALTIPLALLGIGAVYNQE